MPKRLSIIALFAAWLCASGAMLDVVQVFAWANMFTRYARAMPLEQAAIETIDPGKPCPLCLAVRRAREQSKRQQPANVAPEVGKLVLVCDEVAVIVFDHPAPGWSEPVMVTPTSWRQPVPVPPPRADTVGSIG